MVAARLKPADGRRPWQYLAIIASLLPRQLEVAQDKPVTEMTTEELHAAIVWTREQVEAIQWTSTRSAASNGLMASDQNFQTVTSTIPPSR
jgi:hypothetical protein